MLDKQYCYKLCYVTIILILLLVSASILTSCTPPIAKPMRICPGMGSVTNAFAVLELRSQNIFSLKATGQCLLQYFDEDNKRKKENIVVKIWIDQPDKIYLQGDVGFNPKGIILGSNEDEFWWSIKPEINSLWWGVWSDKNCLEKLMISPESLLEAFGIVEVSDKQNWYLSNKGTFDILTKSSGGIETKRIHIGTCDSLVRKIEYFNADGQLAVTTEMDNYKEISGDIFVPSYIKITNRQENSKSDSISITLNLKSVKLASFTNKQKGRLFNKPDARQFKHIYNLNENCDIIEQSH